MLLFHVCVHACTHTHTHTYTHTHTHTHTHARLMFPETIFSLTLCDTWGFLEFLFHFWVFETSVRNLPNWSSRHGSAVNEPD